MQRIAPFSARGLLTSRRYFASIVDENAGDASRRCATLQTAKGRASVLFYFQACFLFRPISGFHDAPTRGRPCTRAAPIPASRTEGELLFPLPVDLLGALLERLGPPRER
ncbi:hypothetical protein C3743_10690 [Burkholderia contaminans]|uniref:Uncharacterized protein n=1 Tax=Burkholderia contaminans TaxID=488447 RepID=A0A2S5E6B0_9BURK|nr:hypothetical protein C3743_10690 [Burkholderia contaminans]